MKMDSDSDNQIWELPIPLAAYQSVPTLVDEESGEMKLMVSVLTLKIVVGDREQMLHIIFSEGY